MSDNRGMAVFILSFKKSSPMILKLWHKSVCRIHLNTGSLHSLVFRGIGMIASSSTFRQPHPPPPIWGGLLGSVPSVACCSAWYGSTSLQQSPKGSCSLYVSGHNIRVKGNTKSSTSHHAPLPTLTSSSVHHSSHQCTALFYRITMSHK